MAQNDWVEPRLWYQSLPTVHIAAMSLILDDAGRVLLVKPNYRPHWTLPGGMAEFGESPDVTVVREVREELGLDITVGRLAVVDWASPQGSRERPIIALIFDVAAVDTQGVHLQRSELDDCRFVSPAELDALMPPRTVSRVREAVLASTTMSTVFLVDGRRPQDP